MSKEKKKLVTFWIDEKTIKKFDNNFFHKSYFIRQCIIKAIQDKNFYNDIINGGK